MRQIDYFKLIVWLGMMAFCGIFWILIFKWKVFLCSLIIMTILIFLIVRKELK